MFFSLGSSTTSVLSLAIAASAAPLNERSSGSLLNRAVGDGWLCQFTGLADATVDGSLNLPLMLGGICAKINYDYEGCESFRPQDPNTTQPTGGVPEVPQPESDPAGNPLGAASFDDESNNGDDEPKHRAPKKAKHHKHPKQSSEDANDHIGAHSFNDSADASPEEPSHKTHHKHHNKHHNKHHDKHPKGEESDADNQIGAHSFDDSSDKDPESTFNPLAAGESDGDDAQCSGNEYYSTAIQQCVDKSFFSNPEEDSTCKKGELDAVIKLCLDLSLLGLTEPITSQTSVLQSKSAEDGNEDCPSGQQYSSLLSTCVDNKFLSLPSEENMCEHGWKLDLVLGICLDLIGCQDHDHTLL